MERNSTIHNSPFISVSISLALGITTDVFLEANPTYWIILLTIGCIKLYVLHRLPLKWKWKLRVAQGIGILLLIFSFGGMAHSLKTKKIKNNFNNSEKIYFLKIIEEYKKTNLGKRLLAEIYQADREFNYLTKCYVYTKDSLDLLEEGDIVMSNCRIEKINNISNPGSYDFQKKSAIRGIYFKTYINDINEFSLIGKDNDKISSLIHKNQEWILETLRQSLNNNENSGLAEAILIGYRDDLKQTLLDSYIKTGAVHVIAISGLHVGLIFSIISLIINSIAGQSNGKWISLFTTLPIIWWFTLVTGSTASVMRSALMSSFNIIGSATDKKSITFNSLMAAAYIQMIDNPDIVSDLGFQLSYSAVGSILIFSPHISRVIYVKNKFIKSCWSMVCVTLAAQLLTMPISIWRFHQFPVLFLFTNLVAVPLSSIILIAEITLCLAHFVKLKTELFSVSINFLIDTMNAYIMRIEAVPFAVINQLFIGVPTFVMLYIIFIVLFYLLQYKKSRYLLSIIVAFSLTCIVHNTHKILITNQRRIAFLYLPGQTCIMVQDGKTATMIANKELLEDRHRISILKNQLANHYWIDKFEFKSITKAPSVILINNSAFLTDAIKSTKRLLLITGNPEVELSEYSKPADSSTIFIADVSNKLWKIQQWETEADKLLLRFHSVAEKGPLILESPHFMFSALKN